MKMLKELKGKKVIVAWIHTPGFGRGELKNYRMEDYCEMPDGIWIKLRPSFNLKQTNWFRFNNVESIGRIP